ncbi:hypothetical protein CRV01_02380 [Arcobacter sp. CECT 8983]|uniref:sensor histidine kinase n=1 Tax=Arcobacter sp. CECT 8983 TaxID=2044508 RepID=UPI00100A9316|nr:HAMP domain-containing sensor histidine kinase [Arcobacter sp. CECT 8983]RXJ91144.1 hypothetical protein CRV01_02380 [Arcobacter sp. CECT 8983]
MKNKDKIKSELEEHFFEIIDQARNGITISDPNQEDNPLIYVNKAFTETFEYSFDEAVGKNCRFLQGTDKDQANLEIIRDAINTQSEAQTVLRNYTKNGELIYNEVKVSPIFDKKTGLLKFFLGIQKDISKSSYRIKSKPLYEDQVTNRIFNEFTQSSSKIDSDSLIQELNIYQAELLAQNDELIQKDKNLQALNEEFSSLFLDAPIPYLLIDSNLEIKRFNHLADEYLGISNSKLMIKSLFFYIKRNNIQKIISWIVNKDYKKFPIEIDVLCKFGNRRRFKFNAKEYMLDNSLIMLSLVDIQEEYEIKSNLEVKVQEELEKRISQEKFIEKQAKLASMGEMIDIIAHQWLNPLTIIRLYAQNSGITISEIENRIEQLDNIAYDLGEIDRQTKHLVDTLNEFRSFFRPDKNSELISMKVLIDSVLVLLKDELTKNRIIVEIEYEKDFKVKVIENQFKHVLINLLTNTRDAFNENNIEDRKITIFFEEDNKNHILKYVDNAGGVHEDNLPKLFDLNFTTKSSSKGTGIGLYLCEQIVKKFTSSIKVCNFEDGVCFTIRFPKYY